MTSTVAEEIKRPLGLAVDAPVVKMGGDCAWLLLRSAAQRRLLHRRESIFLSFDQVSEGNEMDQIEKHLVYAGFFATLLLPSEVASTKDGDIV